MIFDCTQGTDEDIRWYLRSLDKIYPKHLIPLAYQVHPNDPDIAEVDTTKTGWPIKRYNSKKICNGTVSC